MKVLVTGASGQDGSFLCEYYLEKGYEVHGMVRQRSDLSFLRGIHTSITLHIQDIRDPHGVADIIGRLKPDLIHDMAAMTYVPYSWINPLDTFETNVHGTINILQAVRLASPESIIQFAGSSEEFGVIPPEEIPITEQTPVRPASPYGVSKLAGDLLCQQFTRSFGVKTVITRAFNHTSPRRGQQFVTKQVVTQALEIKNGKRTHFTLGNLDAVRDFSDTRDIVEAYYLAVTKPVNFGTPYVICSEKGYSVQELVGMVSELLDIPSEIEQDPSRLRPSDCPILVGSSTKFRYVTGWKPKHELKDTLRWMIETLEGKVAQ